MKACDVMSTHVIAVGPETPARAVAETLLKHGISGVPVVNADGAPLGVITEGDLMPRDVADREARREQWLSMLSHGQDIGSDYLELLTDDDRSASDIMSTPVVTIEADAELLEIAGLLSQKRIKRLPVMRNGRLAGIVSRADLVRAVVQSEAPDVFSTADVHVNGDTWPMPSARLEALTARKPGEDSKAPTPEATLSAAGFHNLVSHHEQELAQEREQQQRRSEQKQHKDAQQFLAKRLTDDDWQRMIDSALAAATRGEEECLLLRFPAEVCRDHGRAINAPDPAWPETLRGMASEVFLRWRSELRPQGFVLHARVVEFPNGIPGDIGLFLAW